MTQHVFGVQIHSILGLNVRVTIPTQIFFGIFEINSNFFHSVPPSSLGCMTSFVAFFSFYEISIIFSVITSHTTPRPWRNMFLMSKYVQFFDWLWGWAYQLTCKIWGHSEYVEKLTSFSGDRSGRTEGPVRKEFFSDSLQMYPHFFIVFQHHQ